MGDWIAAARAAMETEAEAVSIAAGRLDERMSQAVELLLGHPGKTVVTGMGKSGRVAEKIAATLSSTGTPAVFLHPGDAAHGDLGLCSPGDPVVLISKSGATAELLHLLPAWRELRCPLIGILGNTSSPLAAEVDVCLDASVRAEADPHNLAPTASAMVALALGDALAIAVMQAREFTPEHFARFHPAGQLGRNLRLAVGKVMHGGDEVAWVRAADPLKNVVIAMTRRPCGAACVVSPDGRLEGLITDGDLRRALERHDDIRQLTAADVMTCRPASIQPEARLHEALQLMEGRPSQISVLPVVDPADGRCLGLLRLHDIYSSGR